MRTFNRANLPDYIKYNGVIFKHNPEISCGMNLSKTNPRLVIKTLKESNRKGILVLVLSSRLKGKTDLHGKLYKPSKFIFTND